MNGSVDNTKNNWQNKEDCNFALMPNANAREIRNIFEHLYVNTDGIALLWDPAAPLFVRRTSSILYPSKLCFSVAPSPPYYEEGRKLVNDYLDLKFRLFSGTNIRTG